MRPRLALAVIPVLVLLAGCAPEAEPTPSESSTAVPSPSASTTPGASPTPTESAVADFTTAELVQLCTDKVRELAPDATYFADRATTEWLEPVSSWFVVIPKELAGQESAAVCGIHGDTEAPIFDMHGETLLDSVDQSREDLLAAGDHQD